MKLQRSANTCGPLAIVNGARALGVKLTERSVRAHTGTTKAGTTEHGILNALERLGFEYTRHAFVLNEDGWYEQLLKIVADGHPVILSVEGDNHWIAAFGVLGDRVVTFDSWNAKWNVAECGVDVLDKKKMKGWWAPKSGSQVCMGISMWKAK